LLIESGADPNLLDNEKFSSLGVAIREERYKIAYKLI
jgi:hypothetical protein